MAAIPEVEELNIGHSIVSRSVFVGIGEAVREMRNAMQRGRALDRHEGRRVICDSPAEPVYTVSTLDPRFSLALKS